MGRPHVPWVAISLSIGSAPLHAPLLGCPQAPVADDPLRQQPPRHPPERPDFHGGTGHSPSLKEHPLHPHHLSVEGNRTGAPRFCWVHVQAKQAAENSLL